jgi:hypothetical protein
VNGGQNASKKPMKPSVAFTPELGALICEKLRTGQTLRSICLEEGMPTRVAVIEWTYRHPEFGEQYLRDLQTGIDALGEELYDKSRAQLKPEDVPAARHQFDVARWYLGKRAPSRWGDKQQLEVKGDIQAVAAVAAAVKMAPAEVEAAMRAELQKLFSQSEKVLELTPADGASFEERAQAIRASGKPLPSALYRLLAPPSPDD